MLALIVAGNSKALAEACPKYAQEARVDMGFKPALILGGLAGRYSRAGTRMVRPMAVTQRSSVHAGRVTGHKARRSRR
jgi:hypothetical protein